MYKTKQLDIILSYVKSLGDTHFTVKKLYDYFCEHNLSIGVTTIYRNINKLIEKGVVKKYIIDGQSEACFQYINERCDQVHYHLKCKECNKLLHVDCESLDSIISHMSSEHKFLIDFDRTILYGLCDNCIDK